VVGFSGNDERDTDIRGLDAFDRRPCGVSLRDHGCSNFLEHTAAANLRASSFDWLSVPRRDIRRVDLAIVETADVTLPPFRRFPLQSFRPPSITLNRRCALRAFGGAFFKGSL
jgi:hypothetical protein